VRDVTRWAFVVPILWIGFVLAISFMEAPLKFRAPSVTVPIGVEIGHVVFHALNRVEVFFALLVALAVLGTRRMRDTTLSTLAVNVVLFVQTVVLFGPLDARAMEVVAGRSVPESPWHVVYIGLEVAKLVLVVGLSARLVRDFRSFDRDRTFARRHAYRRARGYGYADGRRSSRGVGEPSSGGVGLALESTNRTYQSAEEDHVNQRRAASRI
jgi:hypothetical protein